MAGCGPNPGEKGDRAYLWKVGPGTIAVRPARVAAQHHIVSAEGTFWRAVRPRGRGLQRGLHGRSTWNPSSRTAREHGAAGTPLLGSESGLIGYVPPAEFEAAYFRDRALSLRRSRGDSRARSLAPVTCRARFHRQLRCLRRKLSAPSQASLADGASLVLGSVSLMKPWRAS